MFHDELKKVRRYSSSEIKKDGDAVVLKLKSTNWSFDVAPCFHTLPESNGRSYYLIPNKTGNWQMTDPIRDRDKVAACNKANDGNVLELIRLIKKWGQTHLRNVPSYLLETIIVHSCEDPESKIGENISQEFERALMSISSAIRGPISDLKRIQRDINTLPLSLRNNYWSILNGARELSAKALEAEKNGDISLAFQRWQYVFGKEFPKYDG
ncbi:MAG: hypothetical protein LBJ64_00450 [Deltaproteobacteria bacterium]|jgi:hypothetical protein|nr:hypothetical protein [Deltaproteobacteria bacterium]